MIDIIFAMVVLCSAFAFCIGIFRDNVDAGVAGVMGLVVSMIIGSLYYAMVDRIGFEWLLPLL